MPVSSTQMTEMLSWPLLRLSEDKNFSFFGLAAKSLYVHRWGYGIEFIDLRQNPELFSVMRIYPKSIRLYS